MFKMALQYDSNKILTTKMVTRVLGFVQSHTQWYNIGSEEMPSWHRSGSPEVGGSFEFHAGFYRGAAIEEFNTKEDWCLCHV